MDAATGELRIWHVTYDGLPPVEVIAVDEWQALNMTEPRDSAGRRLWKRAWASDVTPVVPDYCTLTDDGGIP